MTEEYGEEARQERTVYWAGRQWCVTAFGIETVIDQRYYIEAELLGQLTETSGPAKAERFRHVATKTWVDVEDFAAAFAVALALHAGKYTPLPEGAFLNAVAGARRARWISAQERDETSETMADLYRRGEEANARDAVHPFKQVPDPHPSWEEQQRLLEIEDR